MKSGALKETPLWYDVYKKFPPELEPNVERPVPPQDPIPEIVYEEDFDRARQSGNRYKTAGSRTKPRQKVSNVVRTVVDEEIK